ncbi:flavin reductase family protein [Paraburkholderia adhaesiva]|uniref:flavin reductase family protein n=1 Tax=Paraburkholderia adhaesiva TaxID=2883244 RepID=UPI001F32E8F4|nr:flavin reductase family protein [Paraburkholderia adhaesiva]
MTTEQQAVTTNPDCGTLLGGGNPVEDTRAFRRCLGQYPTGVTVVTARHEGELVGMTVNSFASVSLDPPLILWSIRRESRSVEAFTGAQHFVVNVLADDQVPVSQWFATAHPERFELAPWSEGVGGAPLLDGAVVQLECERVAVHEAGDHLILIGEVKQYAHFDGKPLAFSNGGYAQCLPREHVVN